MNINSRLNFTGLTGSVAGASLLALALTIPASAQEQAGRSTSAAGMAQPAQAAQSAKEVIQNWPDVSKKAAKAMMEKYGEPQGVSPMMLVWENNGPWARTIVYGEEVDHDFPMPHKDVLEQVIPYDVPVEKFRDLAAYDGSVIAERTAGTLAARCDKEAANFLAINLAHDIIEGEKSVEEARQAYGDAIKALMAGNPPETTQGFTFEVNRDFAGNPGETIIETAER